MTLRRFRCALLVGLAWAMLLGGLVPATAGAASRPDPLRELGAGSPSCRYGLDARERSRCRASGSVLRGHPLSSYGIDVRAGFSVTDPGETFMGALGSMAAAWWTGLLYVMHAVLLLLEWAFSLDLTNRAMPEVRGTLARLHRQAFGDGWLMLAISIAGLWGIWRGLVQRRTGETLAGLAATVALMVLALAIINRPGDTVGRAAQIANDGGMSILSAATTGEAEASRSALATALRHTFDVSVRDPWCALQFGSVDYCSGRTSDRSRPTNADLWLSYPAQSWERGRLHKLLKGDDDEGFSLVGGAKDLLGLSDDRRLPDDVERLVERAPTRAHMQEAGGTFPRLALLAVISVGLLGAVALYAYLGLRLLLASGMTLLLLLIAPAMLLAPALGDSGRATFIAWGKRLIGALIAKVVFAVFLAVTLAASRVFTHLDLGWFGTWLLLAAFWWGTFLKREELVGFVSAGAPHTQGGDGGRWLSQGYYAWMLGRGVRAAAARAGAPLHAGAAVVQRRRADASEATAGALRDIAGERLDERHRKQLMADHDGARTVVSGRAELERELRAVDRQLRGRDESEAAARASGTAPPAPSASERDLLEHRRRLQAMLTHPAATEAVQVVRHAERNRAVTGDAVTRRDLDAYRARRRRELQRGLPEDDGSHLRAAGVDPDHYRDADDETRQAMLSRVRQHLAEERELLAVAEGETGPAEAASRFFDPAEVRARSAEHHRRLQQERRRRRAGVPRRSPS